MNAKPARLLNRSAALLAVVSLSTLVVPAQPATDGKSENRPPIGRQFQRPDRPGGFQSGPQGGMAGGGLLLPTLQRVLTEEQRASLRAIMEGQREKTRELEEKLRETRRELLKVSVIEKFDEAAVRSKALEFAKLDAEFTVLRAKAFSQMKPALTKEQIEELKNPPPMEGGGNRGEGDRRPPGRKPTGPRDENDLPVPPKPDK